MNITWYLYTNATGNKDYHMFYTHTKNGILYKKIFLKSCFAFVYSEMDAFRMTIRSFTYIKELYTNKKTMFT